MAQQYFVGAILIFATFCNADVVIQDVLWTTNYEDTVGENYFGECRFVQSPCGPNNRGFCVPSGQCATRGGNIADSCQQGFGECCVVTKTCSKNATQVHVDQLVTVLHSEHYYYTGAGTCSFKFRKEPQICQIRLDFIDFETESANSLGDCVTDRFTIQNSITVDNFTTCGSLSGQHMYLTFGHKDTIEVTPTIHNTSSRYFIIATKIPCNSKNLAPDYCLQYFTEPHGNVSSFDFRGQQQNNQRYTICVKPNSLSSSIKWAPCAHEQSPFDIMSADDGNKPMECKNDWVQVSGSERNCNRFSSQVTSWKPYNLLVNFDSYEVINIFSLLNISPPSIPNPNSPEECREMCAVENDFFSLSCNEMDMKCVVTPTDTFLQILALYPADFQNSGFCLEYTQ